MRTILVHLNVETPDSDTRTADEIADAILAAMLPSRTKGLRIIAPLAEDAS